MASETETLPHTVEATSADGNLEGSIETGLLEAVRSLRTVAEGKAEAVVFTDSTPGHAWEIVIEKRTTIEGKRSWRCFATHLPPLCCPDCEAQPRKVAESERVREIYHILISHIHAIAREEGTVVCCLQ